MPELPEAERARLEVERVIGRRIAAVDDRDTFVCRPHAPGEIAGALSGRRLTEVHRRGKFMWAQTDDDGPDLGLHLGMSGRMTVDEPPAPRNWDRFVLEFAGGGRLALRDPRRLGRVVLEPDFTHIGPDAGEVSQPAFRQRIGRGDTPVKVRLLDQRAIAGIGNLLADQILWQARVSPHRRSGDLSTEELDELRRATRAAIRSAIRRGGAHTGELIAHRVAGGHCPRCGAGLLRARIGGRTTYWCQAEQH